MKRSALVILGIALFNLLLASTINVDPGRNSLYDALISANDGDTLMLTQSADYLMDSVLVVDKTIMIMAAEDLDEKPVIKNVCETLLTRNHIQIADGGHLRLNGLEFDGLTDSNTPAKYCISTTEKMLVPYSLFVNDCVMHDFIIDEEGRFFRAYAETYADSVVFTNCLLYNAGRQGICIKDADNTVGYFEISFSTMFNVYHEGIYVQGDSVVFRVNHCTFDNLGYASMDMVRPRFINDTEIINSVFSNVPEPQSRALLVYGPANVDYCVFHNIGAVDIHNTAICQFGDSVYFDVDPQYEGREYGNFQLSNSSPFLTFSTDGSVLGDPNWGQYSGVLPRTIYVGNERNALSDSLKIAKDSDILELTQSGDYLLDSILVIDKTITIKAAEALESKPVLKNVNNGLSIVTLMDIQTGGNLYLDGLELDGLAGSDSAADYLIKTAESIDDSYKLVVKDCILRDIDNGSDGAFFKSYASTSADSIVFKNCMMYNCAGIGLDMIDADNIVDYFEISNSTMYDIEDVGLSLQGSDPIILVKHCNFDNLGSVGNGMINPAGLDVTIQNSIFSNAPDTTTKLFTYYYYGNIDFNNFYKVGPIEVWMAGDNPVGENNMYGVDPMFTDQSNNDYTLPMESPMYYSGEGECHLGDQRWAINAPVRIYKKFYIPAYQNSIYDSLLVAGDRDTLILTDASEYLLDSTLYINKTITIKAAEELVSKPVIKNIKPGYTSKSILRIQENGNLYLNGLDLDGLAGTDMAAKYLIRTDEEIEGFYNLYVNDCVLHDVVAADMGSFFRGFSKTFADTVKFTNCIMYNSGKEGIRIKDADNTVRYFEMSNSTMYHTKTEGIYIQGNEVVFRMDHCTLHDLAWIHADMIRPRYVIDAEITNCIFANTTEPHSRVILLYGTSLMSHNDFYNVGGITKVVVHDSSSYRFGDNMLFEVDPMFANPDGGDFTLMAGSPLYGMGSDGEAMGDLRWATEAAQDTPAVISVPEDYELSQNFPNPFNPITTIGFGIPRSEFTTIDLYDVSGRKIMNLVNNYIPSGYHQVILNASHLSSGIYFYSIKAGDFSAVKKLTLLK